MSPARSNTERCLTCGRRMALGYLAHRALPCSPAKASVSDELWRKVLAHWCPLETLDEKGQIVKLTKEQRDARSPTQTPINQGE